MGSSFPVSGAGREDMKLPECPADSDRPHVTKAGERVSWSQGPGAVSRAPWVW